MLKLLYLAFLCSSFPAMAWLETTLSCRHMKNSDFVRRHTSRGECFEQYAIKRIPESERTITVFMGKEKSYITENGVRKEYKTNITPSHTSGGHHLLLLNRDGIVDYTSITQHYDCQEEGVTYFLSARLNEYYYKNKEITGSYFIECVKVH